jgi:hypothetical protein
MRKEDCENITTDSDEFVPNSAPILQIFDEYDDYSEIRELLEILISINSEAQSYYTPI